MIPNWDTFWRLYDAFCHKRYGVVSTDKGREAFERAFERAKRPLIELLGGVTARDCVAAEDVEPVVVLSIVKDFRDQVRGAYPQLATFISGLLIDGGVDGVGFVDASSTEEVAKLFVTGKTLRTAELRGRKFPAGTKLTKVLRWWVEHEVVNDYIANFLREMMLQEFSKLLQRCRATGGQEVVVSVDPIDFLLMSQHTTGWRSCLRIGGEHCAGVMAYMVDSCTAIAYAPGPGKDVGGFRIVELPVREWRQVVYIDLERYSAVFGRHYPGERLHFEAVARRVVGRALSRLAGLEEPKWVRKDKGTAHIERRSELGYIDGHSSTIVVKCEGAGDPVVAVLERPVCPVCGRDRGWDYDAIVCEDCVVVLECYQCNCRIEEGDGFEGIDGNVYCEECWSELFAHCHECGEVFYRDDLLWGADDELHCESCFGELFDTCYHCGEPVWLDSALEGADGYLYCSYCWGKRFVSCDCCGGVAYRDDVASVNGERLCSDCCDYCERCGEVFCVDDLDEDGLCENCRIEAEEEELATSA